MLSKECKAIFNKILSKRVQMQHYIEGLDQLFQLITILLKASLCVNILEFLIYWPTSLMKTSTKKSNFIWDVKKGYYKFSICSMVWNK